jgi:hypothetical protein
MPSDKARGSVQLLIVLLLVGLVAGRLLRRTPARQAVRQPAPYVHPIVPSPPVVNPPPRNCRVPDLEVTGAYVSALRAKVALADARRLRGEGCRTADLRALQPEIDLIAQSVSGCVAQDAELDGAWNLLQAALMAVRTCADCAAPPAARDKGCARTQELVAEADKARRQVAAGK